MERFFLNLKMERVRQRDDANHIEAIVDIDLTGFYNPLRPCSTLGCRSLLQHERQAASAN